MTTIRRHTKCSTLVKLKKSDYSLSVLVKNQIMYSNTSLLNIDLNNEKNSITVNYRDSIFTIYCAFSLNSSILIYFSFDIPKKKKSSILFIPDIEEIFLLFNSFCTYDCKSFYITVSKDTQVYDSYNVEDKSVIEKVFNKFFSLIPKKYLIDYKSYSKISLSIYVSHNGNDELNQLNSIYKLSKKKEFNEYTKLKLRFNS